MDSPSFRATEEQIAAAQLRLVLDERLGRQTPEIVRRIAAIMSDGSMERQHPSPDPEAEPVSARMSRSEEVMQSADEPIESVSFESSDSTELVNSIRDAVREALEEVNQRVEKVAEAAQEALVIVEEIRAQEPAGAASATRETRPAKPARPQLQPQPVDAASPVQNPLTVVMKAKSPEDYAALRRTVEHLQSLPPDQNPVTVALNKIGTVHFARFAFLNNDQLAVITIYDGDFAVYINEFINEIGDVFNILMVHVEGAPPLPVQAYREEFLDYIRAHDFSWVGRFYSAYPNHTVFDILDTAT